MPLFFLLSASIIITFYSHLLHVTVGVRACRIFKMFFLCFQGHVSLDNITVLNLFASPSLSIQTHPYPGSATWRHVSALDPDPAYTQSQTHTACLSFRPVFLVFLHHVSPSPRLTLLMHIHALSQTPSRRPCSSVPASLLCLVVRVCVFYKPLLGSVKMPGTL